MGDFQATKSPPKRVVAKEQAQTIGRGRPSAQANRPMLSMRLAPMCWKNCRASGKRWQLGSLQSCARCCGDGVHHRQGDRLIGVHGPLCAIACAFFPSAWLAATATQLKATVLGMEAAVLGKIARAANEGHLLDTPDAISVLVEWRKWEGSTDVPRQWTPGSGRIRRATAPIATALRTARLVQDQVNEPTPVLARDGS